MKIALTKPKHGNGKYKRNSNCFSSKTLASCYWAGFIAADGTIVKKSS
jgi:hypothetical protein